MFKPFLIVVLLLSGLPAAFGQGQTAPIVRPRRTDNSPAVAEGNDRQAPSAEARAEAKRLYKAGVKYGTAGLFKQAAQSFEMALKLNPDYADAYFSLGHAYYDLEQWEQAIDSLLRGLALKPKDKEGQTRLAHARTMLERETTSRNDQLPEGNGDNSHAEGSLASLPSASPLAETSKANGIALTKVYRVGPGDVLDIRLTEGTSARSTLFTVTSAGLLEHPDLSAPLASVGLTAEEIRAKMEDDLKRRSLTRSPNVSVGVHEYVSHTILVSGLVKEPGTKILKREAIPLYVVVADAQPLPAAGQVSVLRNESDQSYVIDLDLLAQSEMNLLVRAGDVINLQPSPAQFVYLSGEVKSPGEKTFRRGLTLTQAIIAAGGWSKNAKEARIARDNGKGFLVVSRYKLKDIDSGKVPDPVVQPGDRITIE
jgi:protein involved in polysaccharide export with SLBB domain